MSDTATPTKTISDFEAKLNEADKAVASFEEDDKTIVHKARAFLRSNPTTIPAIILIASILAFGAIANNFMTASTLSLILKQVTVTGIVAIAQTIIILTAGIDLSVGAMLVISAMVMGRLATLGATFVLPYFDVHLFTIPPLPVYLAIPFGVAAGTLMGVVNGSLVTKARIPPFIVTLGTRARNLSGRPTLENMRPACYGLDRLSKSAGPNSSMGPLRSSCWRCWLGICLTAPHGAGMSLQWATIPTPQCCRAFRSTAR
jgi:Branched-chain amino acid transport system / permease component